MLLDWPNAGEGEADAPKPPEDAPKVNPPDGAAATGWFELLPKGLLAAVVGPNVLVLELLPKGFEAGAELEVLPLPKGFEAGAAPGVLLPNGFETGGALGAVLPKGFDATGALKLEPKPDEGWPPKTTGGAEAGPEVELGAGEPKVKFVLVEAGGC